MQIRTNLYPNSPIAKRAGDWVRVAFAKHAWLFGWTDPPYMEDLSSQTIYVWRVCYRVSHSFLADRCGSMVFAIEGFCRLIVADHCSHPPLPVVIMDRIGKYSTESSVWQVPGGRTLAGLPWLPPRCARTCASDTSTKVPNPQAHLLVMMFNIKILDTDWFYEIQR